MGKRHKNARRREVQAAVDVNWILGGGPGEPGRGGRAGSLIHLWGAARVNNTRENGARDPPPALPAGCRPVYPPICPAVCPAGPPLIPAVCPAGPPLIPAACPAGPPISLLPVGGDARRACSAGSHGPYPSSLQQFKLLSPDLLPDIPPDIPPDINPPDISPPDIFPAILRDIPVRVIESTAASASVQLAVQSSLPTGADARPLSGDYCFRFGKWRRAGHFSRSTCLGRRYKARRTGGAFVTAQRRSRRHRRRFVFALSPPGTNGRGSPMEPISQIRLRR